MNHQLCRLCQIYRRFLIKTILTASSPSTTGQHAQTQKLERSHEILKRKYRNLDNLYREAKRQNQVLKNEFERKAEQWGKWYEWSKVQTETLRVKSTSPVENQSDQKNEGRDMQDRMDVRVRDSDEAGMEEDDEGNFFRRTFSPDGIAARRDIQPTVSPEATTVKPRASHERIISPYQKVELTSLDKSTSEKPKFDSIVEGIEESIHNNFGDSKEQRDVERTSKSSDIIEILDVPESPIANLGSISVPKSILPKFPFESSPRPKSAPIQRSRALNSSTPLSTRSSGQKKKKRDYPNMKVFTEDGTDGINPKTPSPVEDDDDDGGLLSSMLEGPPPGPPGISSPLPLVKRKPSPSKSDTSVLKSKSTTKGGQVRESIDIDSDSGSGEVSTPDVKRQKAGPRLRREILSPDLAVKNKGRGRYSTSVLKRYPLQVAQVSD